MGAQSPFRRKEQTWKGGCAADARHLFVLLQEYLFIYSADSKQDRAQLPVENTSLLMPAGLCK